MTFKTTNQQNDFLIALTTTTSNLALVARAGCGKTSTILLGVDAYAELRPDAEILVCAYNKAIADEVKEKLVKAGHTDWRRVTASTMHALGFSLIKYVFRAQVDDNKVRDLLDVYTRLNTLSEGTRLVLVQYKQQIMSLVRYAKQAGFGFFDDLPIGSVSKWFQLADHYDVNGLEETDQMDLIVSLSQVIYKQSLAKTDVVDFDDMVLFPLIKNLRVKFGKDLIFLDEAQDLSRVRQALARKFMKPGGRMVVVGDDRQAIYGFSGADASALPNLIEVLGAKTLPLSVTWRCPKSVVALAQRYVPDIEAAPEAPEGEVIHVDELPADLGHGDAILCRKTAPLIKTAYKLIKSGRACRVEGRAIGEGLTKLVGRWKLTTISALITRLEDYRERELQKARAKGNESKVEEVCDKCDTLKEIIDGCIARGEKTVEDVKNAIDKLFADGVENVIVLATYHRSKGREWKRVILFEHSQHCPSKAARQEWQKLQEDNLAYVAITRAQKSLVFYRNT